MKVYLATGHGLRPDGGFDPGAPAPGEGRGEHELAHVVARVAVGYLHARGVQVRHEHHSGDEAHDPNYVGSTHAANAWGADLAVAVHFDWSQAPRGGFGIYHPGSEAVVLAGDLEGAYRRAGLPTRASYAEAFYFVRETRMPAVIWEADRVGPDVDDDRYLYRLGEAIADGIARHLEVPITEEELPMPDLYRVDGDTTQWLVDRDMTKRVVGRDEEARIHERHGPLEVIPEAEAGWLAAIPTVGPAYGARHA